MDLSLATVSCAGLGLREPHVQEILEQRPPVPWFEVLADNYLGIGGRTAWRLLEIRRDYPVSFHCVGLNLGSSEPLDLDYLDRLIALRERLAPRWISDHLCWTAAQGRQHHDLLPLPFTEEAVDQASERISRIQDRLRERILIENVSAYVAFRESEAREWEFLRAVAERADCHILLDINNIYVNARNFAFDPRAYLEGIPPERVKQIHLAGHDDAGTHLVDTHGSPVAAEVWGLYRESLKRLGPVPVCIERDNAIPAFEALWEEARHAEALQQEVCGGAP